MLKQLACLVALCPLAAAQSEVVMNARVEALSSPGSCPGIEYGVEHSDVLLQEAPGVDLGESVGELVHLSGHLSVDPLCTVPVIVVESVSFANSTLDSCGTPAPGCAMRLRIGPNGLGVWSLWFSIEPQGFLDLGPLTGVWLLNRPIFLLDAGFFAGVDSGIVDINVPPNPNLVGLTVSFQGMTNSIGPVGPLMLTNPRRVTIVPATVPCVQPDC